MADISFETGLREYTINGKTKVVFSPTDMGFIEKVYDCLFHMDQKQDGYKAVLDQKTDEAVFDLARKMDADAREEINAVFGTDICSSIFGNLNVFTVADGLPIWANFILAIVDQFEGAFAEEEKKKNPRIAKYVAKYKK